MTTHINHKIYGIVEDIKKTEKMIELYKGGSDPADEIMEKQHRIRKNKFLRELLSELALSDVSFKEMKGFIRGLTNYLEKTDKAAKASKELKSNLEEVALMLRA